jgi:HlyD family secretion protein
MPRAQCLAYILLIALVGMPCALLTGCHSSVPASAGQTHEPASSTTATSATTTVPSVQTIVPERRNLISQFEQPGVLEAVEEAELFSRVSGYVKSHKVDIGDRVKKGDVLLEVDVPELAQELAYKEAMMQQAEAELMQAKANVDTAQGMLNANQAQVGLAEADVAKAKSDQEFRQREYDR